MLMHVTQWEFPDGLRRARVAHSLERRDLWANSLLWTCVFRGIVFLSQMKRFNA